MKKFLAIILFWMLVFAKCKKKVPEPDTKYFGYAKAEINGVIVNYNKVNGRLLYNLEDSISLNLEKWDGLILKQAIGIQKIFKLTNLLQRIYQYDYTATRIEKLSSSYYTLRDDGDVLCDIYNVHQPDSLQNHVTITSYNSQTKEIWGTFQATYLIDTTRLKCRSNAPDTIKIRNGEFYTKIF